MQDIFVLGYFLSLKVKLFGISLSGVAIIFDSIMVLLDKMDLFISQLLQIVFVHCYDFSHSQQFSLQLLSGYYCLVVRHCGKFFWMYLTFKIVKLYRYIHLYKICRKSKLYRMGKQKRLLRNRLNDSSVWIVRSKHSLV